MCKAYKIKDNMKTILYFGLFVVSIFIFGCQSINTNGRFISKDSTKLFLIKDCKFDFKDKDDKGLYTIKFNDSIVFDSL